LHIAVEVSSGDSGCLPEPASVFHEASVKLSDVIVRTFCPDGTRPDCRHIEIDWSINPNGNHPFPKGWGHNLGVPPFAAKDSHPLIHIGTEPKAGKTVAAEIVHRLLGALLNDCDIRAEPISSAISSPEPFRSSKSRFACGGVPECSGW
jgi:hypothetical protein